MQLQTTLVFRTILLAILFGAALFSCSKNEFTDIDLAEHDAEFAFPLFSTSLVASELLGQVLNEDLDGDSLIINPDNTMTLIYQGDVVERRALDVFEFFADTIIPVPDTFKTLPLDAPDSVRLNKIIFKSGTLRIISANSTGQTITGTLYLPQMEKDGKVFSIPFSLPPQIFPLYEGPEFDVSGYELGVDSNSLQVRYEAYLPNGMRIKVPDFQFGSEKIPGIGFRTNDLIIEYAEGYWGTKSDPLTRDTIEIDLNQTDLNANVRIKNPKITISVFNSWGFPTRGIIKYLSFIGQNGEELALESSVFEVDSFPYKDFDYPSLAEGEVGQTAVTTLVLDETNSNIADIFNSQPTRLIYEVDGLSNAEMIPSLIGFITNESTIRLRLGVELLLEGSAQNFTSGQTVDLSFGELEDLDTAKIESAQFKLVADNSMPLTANIQMYFLRADSSVIDSLFVQGPQPVLEAASVDADGKTTEVKTTANYIEMTSSKFNKIRAAELARLEASFTTTNDGSVPVKILATNQAAIRMGIRLRTRW